MAKRSVLFCCYGNICRSPLAEAVFHDLATKKGVRDQWIIDSAGTSSEEAGNPIYHMSRKTLQNHNITYSHTSRQITRQDFDKFDLILGFDAKNISTLESLKPKNSKAVIRLLTYYHPTKKNKIIADPWYPDTPEAFEEVYQDCFHSCQELLNSE